jgi:Flp pilus assembly protein TadG
MTMVQTVRSFLPKAIWALFLMAIPMADALAQCAMCAATVESNQKAGQQSIATSLNTGIFYLMILPYIIFGTIAFFWYKNAKKQKAAAAARAAARAKARAIADLQGV